MNGTKMPPPRLRLRSVVHDPAAERPEAIAPPAETLQPGDQPGRVERMLTAVLTPIGVTLAGLGVGVGMGIGLHAVGQSGIAAALAAGAALAFIGGACIWIGGRKR